MIWLIDTCKGLALVIMTMGFMWGLNHLAAWCVAIQFCS